MDRTVGQKDSTAGHHESDGGVRTDRVHQRMCRSIISMYTNIQKYGFDKLFIFTEFNTFIQEGGIKLIKSGSKYMYNVTKYLYFPCFSD